MSSEEIPVLPPPDGDFPIVSIVREGDAHDTKAHAHACGQLLYPQQGAALLETRHGVVRLGPDRAAWIPPGEAHSVFMDKRYRYHSLYVDPRLSPKKPFAVILVRALLRELIVDAATWPASGLGFRQKYQRARVIVDEIARAPLRADSIRMPDDRRLSLICRELERNPANNSTLEHWAQQVGASSKTLQRLFKESAGMSFTQWRTQLRMTRAVQLHAQGWRIVDVALAIGYAGEGAYAQAFKKLFGHPPSRLNGSGLSLQAATPPEQNAQGRRPPGR